MSGTLPPLLAGERRRIFVRLLLWGGLQAGCAVLAARLVRAGFGPAAADAGMDAAGLVGLAAGLLLLALLAALGRRFETVDGERLAQSRIHEIRSRVLDRLFRGGEGVAPPAHGAVLVRLGGDLGALATWTSRGLARLVVSGLAVGGTLVALRLLAPGPALVLLAGLLCAALPGLAAGRALERATRRLRRLRGRFAARLGDRLGGILTVRAFARERGEVRTLVRQSARLRAAAEARAAARGRLRGLAEFAAFATPAVIVGTGAPALARGALSTGDLVAALLLAGLFAPRLRELGRIWGYRREARVAEEKLAALLAPAPRRRRGRRELPPGGGRLVLRRVHLAGRLHDVDLVLEAGEKVAVVGANGAGKTSLLLVAGGVLPPDRGRVELDGVPVGALRPAARRRAFAFLGEPFPLLRGTVADNLRLAADGVGEAEMRAVLERVGLDLPPERRLGEGGAGLSAGERARLGLARALFAGARVLVADEPEAALDGEGRALFREILQAHRGTVLFATHDPALLRLADRVVLLEGGRPVADTDPATFLAGTAGRRLCGPQPSAPETVRAVG